MTKKQAESLCKNGEDIVLCCGGCHNPVVQVGPDYLDYCEECEHVVEGHTTWLPESHLE